MAPAEVGMQTETSFNVSDQNFFYSIKVKKVDQKEQVGVFLLYHKNSEYI